MNARSAVTMLVLVPAILGSLTLAAEPPQFVNYQGVLRSDTDQPLDGAHDMVFDFYSSAGDSFCNGGSLLLTDAHAATGTGAVEVTGGMFNVALGSGDLSAGVEGSLAEVFRDNDAVYLQVTVEAEKLCPRIRVVAAGYSLNADNLDGEDSDFYLNTSAAPQEKTGLLTASGGVDFGPGAHDNLTASDVETLTSGALADVLHTHGLVSGADTLDSFDSSQFLRSDTSDTYSSGTLTIAGGTTVDVYGTLQAGRFYDRNDSFYYLEPAGTSQLNIVVADGDVRVGNGSAADDDYVFFDQASKSLSWREADGEFRFSSPLYVPIEVRSPKFVDSSDDTFFIDPGNSFVTGRLAGSLYLGHGSGADDDELFFDAGTESLRWSETNDRFELSATMSLIGDVHAARYYELGSTTYYVDPSSTSHLNGISMHGTWLNLNSDGPDDEVQINFYDDGSYFDEYFRWDNTNDRFHLSNDLWSTHSFTADRFYDSSDNTAYLDPASESWLEHLKLRGTPYINAGGPDGNASIYFHDGGSDTGEWIRWDDADDRFELSNDVYTDYGFQANRFFGSSGLNYWLEPDGTGDSARLAGDLVIGQADGSDNDAILFDASLENLTWDNAQTRFELSDDLAVVGTIQTSTVTGTPKTFNSIGTGTPTSGDMSSAQEMFITHDFEVGQTLYASGDLYMEGDSGATADGDQTVFFYDTGDRSANYITWDDSMSVGGTCPAGAVSAGFRWNIADNSETAWIFQNEADIELLIDGTGDVIADGTFTTSGACDLAEAFLGPGDLEPGTLLVLDPERPESVRASTRAKDSTVVGVVSARPGVLLGGPTADAYPVWEAYQAVREELALLPRTAPEAAPRPAVDDDAAESGRPATQAAVRDERRVALERQAEDLELQLDTWERGNVPVALVGRVPVKADASYGAIRRGDYLGSSDTPGHAAVLDGPGPYFGIAMEELDVGQGRILVYLSQGWYGGEGSASGESPVSPEEPAAGESGSPASVELVDSGLRVVLDRDADDESRFSIQRNGGQGLADEIFRVDEQGNVFARGSFRPAALDVAEYHPVIERVGKGDVLVADREAPGKLRLSREAHDPAVVGIVSSEPGVLLGSGLRRIAEEDPELARQLEEARRIGDTNEETRIWKELTARFHETHAAIGLSGTVPCKVDAGYGAIAVGDLLTTSPTPGHAMRADEALPGTILAKALEPLEAGTGTIRVLVMMR